MAEDYPVNIVFDAIDQVTKPMRRINDRIEQMTAPVRQVNNRMRALGRESGLNRVADAGGRVVRRLGGVRDAIGEVSTRVGVMGGAAAFGLQRMFSSFGRTAEQLQVMREETGASLSFMQEWGFVAEQVGIPQDRLNDSMREFNGRLGELRTEGAGPLAETLKDANPALLEQLEQTESLEEAWSVYMSAMSQANDEQERAALAGAAFSDEGRALGNVAAMGSERVRELRQEARRYGQVMGRDAVQSGKDYMNMQRNLSNSLAGMSVVISGAVLPAVNELFGDLSDWIVDNQDLVQSWATQFAESLPGRLERISEMATSLYEAVGPLADAAGWLFDTFGTGETVLAAVGAVIGGPLIASLLALIPAVISLGVALATTPIGWFLGAVALLAGAVFAVYQNWDKIASFFTDRFDAVRDAFDEGLIQGVLTMLREFNPVSPMADAINELAEYFTGVDLSESGSDMVDSLWGGFSNQWGELTSWLQDKVDDLTDFMPDWMSNWLSGDANTNTRVDEDSPEARQAAAGRQGARTALRSSSRTERRESRVKVDFENLPRGAEVRREGDEDDVPVNVGRAMRPM